MRRGLELLRTAVLHHPPRGRRRVKGDLTCRMMGVLRTPSPAKEVSDGSLYHTPAPVPDPSVATATGTPTQAGPRRHPPRGHCPTDPPRRGRHLEADPLYPLPDFLGLLLASPQP